MASVDSPWRPPDGPAQAPAISRWYGWLAVITAVLAPCWVPVHLVAGGMLSTYMVEWALDHDTTSLWPPILFYGGLGAIALAPVCFGVASIQLRQSPSMLWRVIPWASLMVWPALLFVASMAFDLVRWGYL